MTIDGGMLALVSVILAAIGVVATLLAPRLNKSARVHAWVSDVAAIRAEFPSDSLKISVLHSGRTIENPVYLMTVEVENTGSVDVVAEHFVDKIKISPPSGCEVLSIEVPDDDAIGPSSEILDGSIAGLSWKILKPREKVSVRLIVVADPNVNSLSRFHEETNILVRLRDVNTGERIIDRYPNMGFGIFTLLLSVGIAIGYIYYVSKNSELIAIRYGSEYKALIVEEKGSHLCKISNNISVIRDCRSISTDEAIKIIGSAKKLNGIVAPPIFLTAMLSFASIVYLVLGATLIFRKSIPIWLMGPAGELMQRMRRARATRRN